jgi:membrane protein
LANLPYRKSKARQLNHTSLKHFLSDVVEILKSAGKRFVKERAHEAATTLAFFTVFSIFPLLLVLIFIGSRVLEISSAQQMIIDSVRDIFPSAEDVVIRNLEAVIQKRGTVGVIAIIGLLWSGGTMFYNLIKNVNRAWVRANNRNYVANRLLAIAIIGIFLLLLWVAIGWNWVITLINQFHFQFLDISLGSLTIWETILDFFPTFIRLIIFFSLYRFIPKTKVRNREALTGAIFVVGALRLVSLGLGFALRHGFLQYELIYGSVSAIITIMIWAYLSSLVILFGAHISAAMGRHSLHLEQPVESGSRELKSS